MSVTVCAGERLPAAVAEKLNADVLRLSVAVESPVPERATVCVPMASTSVSVPVAGPVCVGENFSWISQLEFAARLAAPQEFVKILNGGVAVRLVIATPVPPLLFA